MHFKFFHNEIFPFIFSTIIMLIMEKTHAPIETKVIVFWTCFAVNMLLILKFLRETIIQITSYLGIECFTLKKNPRKLE